MENLNRRRTTISTKGRVTIPADLREQFGIKPGTRIDWSEEKGRLVLTPTSARRKILEQSSKSKQ